METLTAPMSRTSPALVERVQHRPVGETHLHRSDSIFELTTNAPIALPAPENHAIQHRK